MFITHKEEIVFIDDFVDDIICNVCGKSIPKNPNTDIFEDCLDIQKEWGYDSNYDNEVHTFHICQDCYKKFIKTFQIPIEISEME